MRQIDTFKAIAFLEKLKDTQITKEIQNMVRQMILQLDTELNKKVGATYSIRLYFMHLHLKVPKYLWRKSVWEEKLF